MEHDDPAIRLASVESLRKVTGQDHGVEVAKWRKALGAQVAAAEATQKATANAAPKGAAAPDALKTSSAAAAGLPPELP
jgi:hypothetical protein